MGEVCSFVCGISLMIDTGSLSMHCIQIHTFSTIIVVTVYHTDYDRLPFSPFDDTFVVMINLKL